MKRTKVPIHIAEAGRSNTTLEAIEVEARCELCEYFEDLKVEFTSLDKGHCHFKPRKTLKEPHDWCSKFKPDENEL